MRKSLLLQQNVVNFRRMKQLENKKIREGSGKKSRCFEKAKKTDTFRKNASC